MPDELERRIEVVQGEVVEEPLSGIQFVEYRDPARQIRVLRLTVTDELLYRYPAFASELKAMAERMGRIEQEIRSGRAEQKVRFDWGEFRGRA